MITLNMFSFLDPLLQRLGVLMSFGLYYCPTFSKMAGFVGRNNIRYGYIEAKLV